MGQSSPDYHHGQMDVAEQKATFRGAMAGTKWGSLAVAVFLVFATLFFCTSTGFIGSAVPAAVLLGLGILVLRQRAPAH